VPVILSDVKPEKVRYARSQKFRLSEKGTEAVKAYEVTILAARQGHGRAEFDAARKAWGAPRGLAPEDAQYLVEFGMTGHTIKEAADALRDCGPTAQDVKDATERLIRYGMLEAVPMSPG
jgi:hypothetical protein